jgi:hypothetical protein
MPYREPCDTIFIVKLAHDVSRSVLYVAIVVRFAEDQVAEHPLHRRARDVGFGTAPLGVADAPSVVSELVLYLHAAGLRVDHLPVRLEPSLVTAGDWRMVSRTARSGFSISIGIL